MRIGQYCRAQKGGLTGRGLSRAKPSIDARKRPVLAQCVNTLHHLSYVFPDGTTKHGKPLEVVLQQATGPGKLARNTVRHSGRIQSSTWWQHLVMVQV